MPEETMSASQIWERAVSIVKDRIVHMSLWQTLENSVGLILEDDTFVVGLPPRIINQASLLATSEHRNTIEKALASVIGRGVRLRVIEGDCLADWENLKQREARVQAMRDAAYARNQQRIATSQSWDEILEGAARAWSACDMRALPQTKARYVRAMVGIIQEAINSLCPNGVDEVSERLIAKVIDRVATNAEVPATVVALELERTQRLRE
jgi:hypothetical protein